MTKFVDNFESSLIGQDRTSEKYRLKTEKFVTQSQTNKEWFGSFHLRGQEGLFGNSGPGARTGVV